MAVSPDADPRIAQRRAGSIAPRVIATKIQIDVSVVIADPKQPASRRVSRNREYRAIQHSSSEFSPLSSEGRARR